MLPPDIPGFPCGHGGEALEAAHKIAVWGRQGWDLATAQQEIIRNLAECLKDHGPMRQDITGRVETCNRWDECDAEALAAAMPYLEA